MVDTPTVERAIADVFSGVGATGFVHARDLDTGAEIGHRPDEPVVLASVFKIPVLLELACRIAEGEVDPVSRVRVDPEQRVPGPTGMSALHDAVEMSVRDLAVSMMSVSDNTATDVLMALLGCDRIQARLDGLGLTRTKTTEDCAALFSSAPEDMGIEGVDKLGEVAPDAIRRWRALDPARTNASTPREITELLRLIWSNEAGPPEACAFAQAVMAKQIWPHRLRSGFGDGVTTAAKTGTLPGIRNEVGVVHDVKADRRFAVAVFTREESLASYLPAVDAAIGRAARLAVDHLRVC